MEKLCETLRQMRKNKNITQGKMAELLGLNRSTYSLYEIGLREPSIDTLKNISELLDTPLDKLLGIETSNYSLIPNEIGLLHNYRILNEIGKDKVVEYTKDLTKIPEYQKSPLTERQTLNAAHAMEGASKEDMEHDETIMNDDSEWQ